MYGNFKQDIRDDWTRYYPIDECHFDEHTIKGPRIIGNGFNLGEWLNTSIGRQHVPTFSTFNIRRDYGLRVRMTIGIDKPIKAEFIIDQIILLAADYAPDFRECLERNWVTDCVNDSDDEEDTAPDYADVGGAPPTYNNTERH